MMLEEVKAVLLFGLQQYRGSPRWWQSLFWMPRWASSTLTPAALGMQLGGPGDHTRSWAPSGVQPTSLKPNWSHANMACLKPDDAMMGNMFKRGQDRDEKEPVWHRLKHVIGQQSTRADVKHVDCPSWVTKYSAEKSRVKRRRSLNITLATNIWYLAKSKCDDDVIWAEALDQVDEQMPAMQFSQLAIIMRALARSDRGKEPVVQKLMKRLCAKLQQGAGNNTKDLINTYWSLGRLGLKVDMLMGLLEEATCKQWGRFRLNQLCTIIWTKAVLGYQDSGFVHQVIQQIRSQCEEVAPRDVAVLMWGFAMLGHRVPETWSWVNALALQGVDRMTLVDLSTTASALAKGEQYDSQLVEQVVNRAVSLLGSGGMDSTYTSIGSGALEGGHGALASGSCSSQSPPGTGIQCVANLVWACAKMRYLDPPLMTVVVGALKSWMHELDMTTRMKHFPQVLSSCAKLNYYEESLLNMVAAWLQSLHVEALKEYWLDVLTLSWSLAVLQYQDHDMFIKIMTAAQTWPLNTMEAKHLSMLLQVHMWLEDNWPGQMVHDCLGGGLSSRGYSGASLTGYLPQPILDRARRAWASQPLRISLFQRSVYETLCSLGVRPRLEYPTEDGLFKVDIAVMWKGCRVAVEADGPHHFLVRPRHSPMGDTLYRWRALSRRGWAVMSVRSDTWDSLTGQKERQQFLKDQLTSTMRNPGRVFAPLTDEQQAGASSVPQLRGWRRLRSRMIENVLMEFMTGKE